MRLTDLSIKALKAPDKGARIYHDDTLTGFGVRITAGGVKSFVLTYGAMRQRRTIGRVGIVGLQDARSAAKKFLAAQTLGAGESRSVGWNTALQTYLSGISQTRKSRTHADYSRLLKKHFRFGDTKLSDVTPEMIDGKLGKLSGTPAEQQHAFVVLRAFMKWCYRKSYLDRNPMDRMEEPKGYTARDRVLTDDELRKLWNALEDNTFGKVVKLLILTGCRETEIAHLTPDMIKGDAITLPAWLTKNRKEHTFPVGALCAQVLASTRCKSTAGLLFPARTEESNKLFSGWSKCKAGLDKRSGVSGYRLHDLRRTYATNLQRLGVKTEVIECLLNHISG